MPTSPDDLRPQDAASAIFSGEEAMCDRIVLASGIVPPASRAENAFGKSVTVDAGAGPLAVARAVEHAQKGERVAVIAQAAAILASPSALGVARDRGIPIVAHVVADAPEANAMLDFGWGALASSGAGDALDLALVARRAAEDSRMPFFVIHDRAKLDAPSAAIDARSLSEIVSRFVGPASFERGDVTEKNHVFAERVPFALGSAFRDYEKQTGRGVDEIAHGAPAHVALVAAGSLGALAEREAVRLAARGDSVFSLKITALRPFPGPRIVKALSRAHLVVVIEASASALAQSHALSREIKSAFADALTWAPGYPGIGKIPRIVSLVAESGVLSPDAVDLLLTLSRADHRAP